MKSFKILTTLFILLLISKSIFHFAQQPEFITDINSCKISKSSNENAPPFYYTDLENEIISKDIGTEKYFSINRFNYYRQYGVFLSLKEKYSGQLINSASKRILYCVYRL